MWSFIFLVLSLWLQFTLLPLDVAITPTIILLRQLSALIQHRSDRHVLTHTPHGQKYVDMQTFQYS